MSSLSSIRAGERVGGMKMTKMCIYCGIKENDGHPDDRNDFVCDRCRGIVRNFYKDIEELYELDSEMKKQLLHKKPGGLTFNYKRINGKQKKAMLIMIKSI
mgnify:CR=1 FL=1